MLRTIFGVLGVTVVLAACGGSQPAARSAFVEDGSVARASVLGSASCGARAELIELPEHCAWPDGARRTMLLETTADVIVDVAESGAPRGARLVRESPSPELDAAVLECAMQGRYRPALAGAGETCPLTIRMRRYVTDVAPRQAQLPGDCPAAVPGMYPAMMPVGCSPDPSAR